MQPFTGAFSREFLTPQKKEITIGSYRYKVELSSDKGVVWEIGQDRKKAFPMVHVLGGKNVYYFLTPSKRGRLQTLPLAYDVKKKEWFDTAASGIRHIPRQGTEAGIHWSEWPYTFNTSCYGCHVSQYASNYDLKTDTYHTTWAEPGINCETCHGPANNHVRVCRQAPTGTIPQDLQIIRGGKKFTAGQNNESCASCHSKSIPLTSAFVVGTRFFDSYDLVTLENPDYYPDGRDLGENYTYTSWLLSSCTQSGQLSCLHCHTSSGRFRQKNNPNLACAPCHDARVKNVIVHSHHRPDGPGNRCIDCHMHATEFARMVRTDHSMLPPTPAATTMFKSPNACNSCHKNESAAWADEKVRQWFKADYQKPILYRAGLIESARKRDWSRRPEMFAYLGSPERHPVFAASLIRLLSRSQNDTSFPVFLKALKDPSPLVRSAAAEALGLNFGPKAIPALFQALKDENRLVRVKAAVPFASHPKVMIPANESAIINKALKEYLEAMMTLPDLWTSHYNLGNYYLGRGESKKALDSYAEALRLEPRSVLPNVNASLAYARMGEMKRAETSLQKALQRAPDNGAANFNLGLLKAERGEFGAAAKYLHRALKIDPQMDQAAYNLCQVVAKKNLGEAIGYCRIACELCPENPKYTYSLAYYLNMNGEKREAKMLLEVLRQSHPEHKEAALLLREILGKGGSRD